MLLTWHVGKSFQIRAVTIRNPRSTTVDNLVRQSSVDNVDDNRRQDGSTPEVSTVRYDEAVTWRRLASEERQELICANYCIIRCRCTDWLIDPGVDGLKRLRLTPKLFDWWLVAIFPAAAARQIFDGDCDAANQKKIPGWYRRISDHVAVGSSINGQKSSP